MKIDRTRLSLITISALPLAVGALLASMLLDSALVGEVVAGNSRIFTIEEILIQVGVSTGLGSLIVFSLFYIIEKRGPGTKRTIVALVVSPILTASFFLLGQSLLLILFKGSTPSLLPSLLSLATIGILLMSFIFIVMDSVPPIMKNLFVVFYGSVFGTFLGVIFITASMFVLVISVVFEDYYLTKHAPAAKDALMIDTPGDDPFDYARIQSKGAAVGVGDYLAFSLISAHAFLFFPFHVWIMSIMLALIGIIINATIIAKENQVLPGIPLPAILALLPWAIHLIMMGLLGA
ncbi:hypothetical protein EU528_11400 [Candidatus Thorarchaeota archaeon]|nr:MAG: hypothetical protein EU528_11400 [Candidatus Thorarchaeota archaeon]